MCCVYPEKSLSTYIQGLFSLSRSLRQSFARATGRTLEFLFSVSIKTKSTLKAIHAVFSSVLCPVLPRQVVYLATHKGKKCAVKTLRSGASEEDKAEYIRESEAILSFDHESIVGCVGVAVQQRPWLLVLEFVAHRDLKKVLTNIKANDLTLNAKEIATLCVNVCRGMEYMCVSRTWVIPLLKGT